MGSKGVGSACTIRISPGSPQARAGIDNTAPLQRSLQHPSTHMDEVTLSDGIGKSPVQTFSNLSPACVSPLHAIPDNIIFLGSPDSTHPIVLCCLPPPCMHGTSPMILQWFAVSDIFVSAGHFGRRRILGNSSILLPETDLFSVTKFASCPNKNHNLYIVFMQRSQIPLFFFTRAHAFRHVSFIRFSAPSTIFNFRQYCPTQSLSR